MKTMKSMAKVFLIFVSFLVSTFAFAKEPDNNAAIGRLAIKEAILKAQVDLAKKRVYSRAAPSKLVVNVVPASVIHRLIVVENLSKNDIATGKVSWLYDHVGKYSFDKLSLRESNKNTKKAHARGVLQITKGGYDYVAPLYKESGVEHVAYKQGVKDPVFAAKVAILYVDSTLAALNASDLKILSKNKELVHDYVAAAYNGGITYALNTLRKGSFAHGHKEETREYVAKMRMARNIIRT